MPYMVKKQGDEYCVFKKGLDGPIRGGAYSLKGDAGKHRDALNAGIEAVVGAMKQREGGVPASSLEMSAVEEMVEAATRLGPNGSSAIQALQEAPPQLTTLRDVEIVMTGIEYPLASGVTTFTPDDLVSAVGAQQDPAIAQPRIWLGHADDPRIHGERVGRGIPSGEPAIGRVTNMSLIEEGQTIIGDLEGIPLWLARIMASAYPSRSIEGNWDVETVTGHKWDLVINGLALLGVVWPGVSTLEDIASLYTEAGPDDVEVIEATKERPVTIIATAERTVEGQVTVEDLRRQYYEELTGDQAWWWIRAIYLEPNELIVDDDEGSIYRVTFDIDGEEVSFNDAKEVKVKYVNASNGAVTAEPVNAGRAHVALFASRAEARPDSDKEVEVKITLPTSIDVNLEGVR